MKLLELLNHGKLQYEIIQGQDMDITSLTIDSRAVKPGALFVCVPGMTVDGHIFIHQAVEKGAAAVLIEKEGVSVPEGVTAVKVRNSREALSYIAANFYGRPFEKFKLIGVTGTNGKTSTVYFMENILKEHGRKVGIIGTVDTRVMEEHIDVSFATSTTPDTIQLQEIFGAMAEKQADHVVMEVTSHALELHKVIGITYDVSIFTNLTQDHLDIHKTMDHYRDVKSWLFAMSKKSVINMDDPAGTYMVSKAAGEVLTYSIDEESDLHAVNIEYSNTGVAFNLTIEGTVHSFKVPIPGRFTVYNTLGVIGAALCLDIPIETIKKGLEKLQGVPGRIQSVPNDKGIGVFVDYAHTPDGLDNIISAVREFTPGRVITIFGCGGDRDRTKRPIMGEIAGKLSDYCIITSDNPRTENPDSILTEIEPGTKATGTPYTKLVDRREAICYAIKMAQPGDSVIIAGKGHENYQIFREGTVHFDDVEEAAKALGAI